MSFNVLNRKIHYWSSFIVAVPLLVITATGVLLQVKKQSTWIQPAEQVGTGTVPVVGLDDILESVKRAPGVEVNDWDDVDRLDVRPGKGIVKVLLVNGWEVQVDLGSGAVLQSAYRRSDVIESIHDGSFFGGDWTKLGLFLPTGAALFLLWLGGMWMWWVPFAGKRRLRRRRAASSARWPTVSLVAALALGTGCTSPAEPPAASAAVSPGPSDTAPTFVPLLGHWETGTAEGQPTITGDATRWDGEPRPDFDAIVAQLLGATDPDVRANLNSAAAYPIAISTAIPHFEGGTLSVEFSLIGGETDQIAGLLFDLRPNGDYHYVRYNTRDDDIALWRFRNGERENLAHGVGMRRLDFDTWYPLVLSVDGREITASAAGALTLDYTLDEPVLGHVGVWTKRDSITSFRNLRAR